MVEFTFHGFLIFHHKDVSKMFRNNQYLLENIKNRVCALQGSFGLKLYSEKL